MNWQTIINKTLIGISDAASLPFRVIQQKIQESEKQEQREQFQYEMSPILEPMTEKFLSESRTFEETKAFFNQIEDMFREWKIQSIES